MYILYYIFFTIYYTELWCFFNGKSFIFFFKNQSFLLKKFGHRTSLLVSITVAKSTFLHVLHTWWVLKSHRLSKIVPIWIIAALFHFFIKSLRIHNRLTTHIHMINLTLRFFFRNKLRLKSTFFLFSIFKFFFNSFIVLFFILYP